MKSSVPQMPDLPKEAQEKLAAMKEKVEKFTKAVTKEHKEIIGIELLPPSKVHPDEKLSDDEIKKRKDAINLLVLITTEDRKDWFEVKEKIQKTVTKKAEEVDKNLVVDVMDLYELRENCFDGKYEVLATIASGAPLYDPKDMIAAIKISEVHKNMTLKKFEKYIVSYVGAGSLFRGEKSHDIDVYLVVDDTDVKKMTRAELKDKLGAIIRGMGAQASEMTGVQKQFHIQTYILTDFWDAVKDANPVIYTFLRDGVPLYDRGVFMPWKLLLKMGRIKPSSEAIEMQMDLGERLVQRTKGKLLSILGEDLYYAILNPAQAALMLYGIAPPTPKETVELMEEVFVKKEKLLEKKYVDILEKIRKYYKDIEHGDVKEVRGKDVDELLEQAEDYLKRIKKLFNQIQSRRDKENVEEMYVNCMNAVEDALKLNNIPIKDKNALPGLFKKHMVETRIFPEKALELLKVVIDTRVQYAKKKLTPAELEKIRKEARGLIKMIVEYMQRKRGYELERARVRFKYEEKKYGELILLDKLAFIVKDIDAEEKEIMKASVKADGSLSAEEKSSIEELEKHLAKMNIQNKVFIKEKIFEALRKMFGKDIEILVNY